ncbi:hypothetical protein ACHAXR_001994, partial [Thalassiosira sp. AJA248-18]
MIPSIRQAALFCRRQPSSWRAQVHQLAFRSSRSSAVAGSSRSNEDGFCALSSASSATSPDDKFAQPNYLAWGVMASVTASLFGLNHANCDHVLWHKDKLRGRGYHTTVACCESNNSNPSNKSGSSGDESKSDSFFDMAQQWASDYALSKNKSATDKNDNRNEGGSKGTAANHAAESIQTPEDLLEAMGILGGSAGGQSGNDCDTTAGSKQRSKEKINDGPNDLKGVMQKFLFKFDDFQSSLPKSSLPSTKEEEVNHASNNNSCSEAEVSNDDSSNNIFSEFLSFANNASLFTRKSSTPPPDIEELIQQAQSIANNISAPSLSDNSSLSQDSSPSSSGFLSQVMYFQKNAQAIQQAFESSFGPHFSHIEGLIQSLPLTAMHYYLEHEDSIKTPSWKRRIHRFQRDVEVMEVGELNEALILSELSYADSVEEIRGGLERLYTGKNKPQWELLFCDTESRPNEPSHFVAIQKNAAPYDDALKVLIVVRGTKSMSDLITDAMMEATDYEYTIPGDGEGNVIQGKAHSGMVQSGKYLVNRHQKLLETLLTLSKKRKLDITLIG